MNQRLICSKCVYETVAHKSSRSVKVYATPEFGMATIWDADILIWAASVLNAMRKKGLNDIPRKLNFQAYEVLKTIGRDSGGRDYQLLRDALGRLQSTTIRTNIRPKGKKEERQFSWIDSWSDLVDETTGQSIGMTLTVSDWFHEGVLLDKNLLAIDPAYFTITGGRERWLYRVARKHAGAAGPDGFAIPMPTLFEKSGAEGTYRRFKFEMLALAKKSYGADSVIPGFDILIEIGKGTEPSLRMIRHGQDRRAPSQPKASLRQPSLTPPLTDQTIQLVRRHCPGWDVYALKSDFDAWLLDSGKAMPDDYQKAFYGFAKQHHERHG